MVDRSSSSFNAAAKSSTNPSTSSDTFECLTGMKPQWLLQSLDEGFSMDGRRVSRHHQYKTLITWKLLSPLYILLGGDTTEQVIGRKELHFPPVSCLIPLTGRHHARGGGITRTSGTCAVLSKSSTRFLLETNYDHWNKPPFYDEWRTPVIDWLEKIWREMAIWREFTTCSIPF